MNTKHTICIVSSPTTTMPTVVFSVTGRGETRSDRPGHQKGLDMKHEYTINKEALNTRAKRAAYRKLIGTSPTLEEIARFIAENTTPIEIDGRTVWLIGTPDEPEKIITIGDERHIEKTLYVSVEGKLIRKRIRQTSANDAVIYYEEAVVQGIETPEKPNE